MTLKFQRVESAALAVGIAVVFVVAGFPWWALLAAFLVFDLSMLGYLSSPKRGAFYYNLVHNFSGPALLAAVYALGSHLDHNFYTAGLIAGCWGFHVALDRTLGYGLKTEDGFQHTHLGVIGRGSPELPSSSAG